MQTSSASFLLFAGFTAVLAACESRSIVVSDAATDTPNDLASDAIADIATDAPSDIVPTDATDVQSVDAADVAPDAADDATSTDAIDDTPVGTDAADDVPDVAITDDAGDAIAAGWTPLGSGSCNARQRAVPVQEAVHVDIDASISWLTNPPSSGPHFPIWAHWGTFPEIPPGYWVHNLEHSGVVFLHTCVEGTPECDAIVAALRAGVDTIPDDPACMPTDADPTRVRVVVTHYEPLDTPIAGAAWGWLYAADCVDPESMRLFYTMHSGMTYENFCSDGYYP